MIKHFSWIFLLVCSHLQAGVPSRIHSLAQVGDGGGIRTVFLVSNHNAEAATVTLRFLTSSGEAFSVSLNSSEPASSFEFQLPAGGTLTLATAGTGDPRSGWVLLQATRAVGAQALFEIRDGEERLVTQAAVEAADFLQVADIFVDSSEGSSTGVALVNLFEAGVAEIDLTLRNEMGMTVATRRISLDPLNHTAQFVNQLFPELGAVRGVIRIVSSAPISVLALQQTGLVLGTLPPIQGVQ